MPTQAWAQGFVARLQRGSDAPSRTSKHATMLDVPSLLAEYRKASRRLIIVGVGGTILPSSAIAGDNHQPLADESAALLARLRRDPANTLLLVSS